MSTTFKFEMNFQEMPDWNNLCNTYCAELYSLDPSDSGEIEDYRVKVTIFFQKARENETCYPEGGTESMMRIRRFDRGSPYIQMSYIDACLRDIYHRGDCGVSVKVELTQPK